MKLGGLIVKDAPHPTHSTVGMCINLQYSGTSSKDHLNIKTTLRLRPLHLVRKYTLLMSMLNWLRIKTTPIFRILHQMCSQNDQKTSESRTLNQAKTKKLYRIGVEPVFKECCKIMLLFDYFNPKSYCYSLVFTLWHDLGWKSVHLWKTCDSELRPPRY